jgi:hypothetical protein
MRAPHPGALAAIFLLVIFSRRPAQFLSPQVWSEDGLHIVPDFLSRGWRSVFYPLYDYLMVASRLVSGLSLEISVYHYPLVSTLLASGVMAAVGIAIARSPTSLRAPAWCALAVFLVPSDPEVFALPLYAFWWTTLLLLLAALWNDEGRAWGWRIAFIVLAGLSSPVIVLIPPALAARALVVRHRRHEWLAAAVAAVVACIQVAAALGYQHDPGKVPVPAASILQHTLPVLVGKFLAGSWGAKAPMLWTAVILLASVALLHLRKGNDRRTFWTLACLLAGSLAMVAVRVDPVYLDTRSVGPRYFFLPFVLVSWMLVQCVAAAPRSPQGVTGLLLLLAAGANALPVWSRSHVEPGWADHLRSCARFASYPIPILLDGSSRWLRYLELSGNTCAGYMSRGLWPASREDMGLPTFPYAVLEAASAGAGEEPGVLESATMQGADSSRSSLPGYRVIGSFQDSGAATGEVRVQMTRNGRLRYRSGAGGGQILTILGRESEFVSRLPSAPDWVLLEFGNAILPERFVVRIEDRGRAPEEWSAVAIRWPQPPGPESPAKP